MSSSNIPPAWRCLVTRDADGTTRIALAGELDMAVAPEVGAELDRALGESSTVTVDLRQLVFIDTSGMHLLASAEARARRSHTRLVITHPVPSLRRLLELTGMNEVLQIVTA